MAQKKRGDQDFHEFMPAYMDQADLFEQAESEAEPSVRNSVLRQLGFLVLLLVLQIVLFFILIQNTVNLT